MAVKINDIDAVVAGGEKPRRSIPRRVARWLGKAAVALGAIVLAATGAGKSSRRGSQRRIRHKVS